MISVSQYCTICLLLENLLHFIEIAIMNEALHYQYKLHACDVPYTFAQISYLGYAANIF